MKQKSLLITIVILVLVLIFLSYIAISLTKRGSGSDSTTGPSVTAPTQPTNPPTAPTDPPTQPTDPTGTAPTAPTQPTTVPPTSVPPTTLPPTTPPSSEPAPTGMYTRQELEALSTKSYGYGPGNTSDGKRPPYAVQAQQNYGKYGGNFIAPDNGNIYLTFDCGYEYTATDANGNKYRVTEKILNTLKEKDVKAVFFVTMDYVKKQPDLVQRMIDEGHVVGNHSNTHPVMPKQTIDRMIDEVMILHNYVLDKFGYTMNLFRHPTGEYSAQSLAVVQNLGYKNVHWSFAYLDYDTSNQPEVSSALARVTGHHHSGAIYLLHAVSTTNAALLGDAIDFFRAEGYKLELFR